MTTVAGLTFQLTSWGTLIGCRWSCRSHPYRGSRGQSSRAPGSGRRLPRVSPSSVISAPKKENLLTLVCNPLPLLDSLGPGAQRHKVSLDNVLGARSVQPRRQRPRPVGDRRPHSGGWCGSGCRGSSRGCRMSAGGRWHGRWLREAVGARSWTSARAARSPDPGVAGE